MGRGGTSVEGHALGVTKSEEMLVSRLRSGDEEAFEAVVSALHGALIRRAMRYVANREAAEDVVQETWLVMIQGVNRFEGRSSVHAWICAILIHKAKDRGVRETRYRTFSDFECKDDGHRDPIDSSHFWQYGDRYGHSNFPLTLRDDRTPEKLLASKQIIALMQQAVDTLPTLPREVLVLRDVHGVQAKEACRTLNISETNLYVRLHRARARVRMAVEAALG